MINYKINRLTHRATVGFYDDDNPTYDQNDNPMPSFTILKTIWYGTYKLTTTQRLTIAGNDRTINKMIAVRHEEALKANQIIKLEDDKTYQIKEIDVDEAINGFDVITLVDYERRD